MIRDDWPCILSLWMGLLKPRVGRDLAWAHIASNGRAGARTQVCWLPTLFPLGPATALPHRVTPVRMKESL